MSRIVYLWLLSPPIQFIPSSIVHFSHFFIGNRFVCLYHLGCPLFCPYFLFFSLLNAFCLYSSWDLNVSPTSSFVSHRPSLLISFSLLSAAVFALPLFIHFSLLALWWDWPYGHMEEGTRTYLNSRLGCRLSGVQLTWGYRSIRALVSMMQRSKVEQLGQQDERYQSASDSVQYFSTKQRGHPESDMYILMIYVFHFDAAGVGDIANRYVRLFCALTDVCIDFSPSLDHVLFPWCEQNCTVT